MIEIFFLLLAVILLIGSVLTSAPVNIILGVLGILCLLIGGVPVWLGFDLD